MRVLGVDFGDARTGVAVSDPTGFLASAVTVIKEYVMEKTASEVMRLAKEYSCETIVLGYPKNMNSTIGERALKTEKFAQLLKDGGFAVELLDERGTTISAHHILSEVNKRGAKRKEIVDAVAATIILQSYLDSAKFKSRS